MAADIISPRTRRAFREWCVTDSVLGEITGFFNEQGVECGSEFDVPENTYGERRTLVERYYFWIDWTSWKDVRPIVKVFENILIEIEDRLTRSDVLTEDQRERAQNDFVALERYLARDGFTRDDLGRLHAPPSISLSDLDASAAALDVPHLREQIDRIRQSVDEDPTLAIGTAKELLETTCKTILHARGAPPDKNADLPALMKSVRATLDLLPEDIPDTARGAESIKRLLANLGTVAQGLAELRNLYGTGHGRDGRAKGLSPRHARLAVGSATTAAMFLLETHEDREC